jgi:hypothetical protein
MTREEAIQTLQEGLIVTHPDLDGRSGPKKFIQQIDGKYFDEEVRLLPDYKVKDYFGNNWSGKLHFEDGWELYCLVGWEEVKNNYLIHFNIKDSMSKSIGFNHSMLFRWITENYELPKKKTKNENK